VSLPGDAAGVRVTPLDRRAYAAILEVCCWIGAWALFGWLGAREGLWTLWGLCAAWVGLSMGLWAAEWRRRVDDIGRQLEVRRRRR
jgi:hypothetical protein